MVFRIKGKRTDRHFGRKMEQFCAYGEHFGLLMGGGWNTKDKTAEFFPEAHKPTCCTRMPSCWRMTAKTKARMIDWLIDHGLDVKVDR